MTKEKFHAYEIVRQSGVTNMYSVETVSDLSDLTEEEIVDIMKNYNAYAEKFGTDVPEEDVERIRDLV